MSSIFTCKSKATAFEEDDVLYVTCISKEYSEIVFHNCSAFGIKVRIMQLF